MYVHKVISTYIQSVTERKTNQDSDVEAPLERPERCLIDGVIVLTVVRQLTVRSLHKRNDWTSCCSCFAALLRIHDKLFVNINTPTRSRFMLVVGLFTSKDKWIIYQRRKATRYIGNVAVYQSQTDNKSLETGATSATNIFIHTLFSI